VAETVGSDGNLGCAWILPPYGCQNDHLLILSYLYRALITRESNSSGKNRPSIFCCL